MAEERLDCRGLACPGPVLKTKEHVERGGVTRLGVLVDNTAARENVSRFLGRMGFDVSVSEGEGVFEITGARAESVAACDVAKTPGDGDGQNMIAVMVATDRMGNGDDVLGRKLLVNFLGTLTEMGKELWRLIFVNGGVKLTVEESDCLSALKGLETEGVHILVCGTCLNHFGILEKKAVGETTNMLDIVTAMQLADKVITLT